MPKVFGNDIPIILLYVCCPSFFSYNKFVIAVLMGCHSIYANMIDYCLRHGLGDGVTQTNDSGVSHTCVCGVSHAVFYFSEKL